MGLNGKNGSYYKKRNSADPELVYNIKKNNVEYVKQYFENKGDPYVVYNEINMLILSFDKPEIFELFLQKMDKNELRLSHWSEDIIEYLSGCHGIVENFEILNILDKYGYWVELGNEVGNYDTSLFPFIIKSLNYHNKKFSDIKNFINDYDKIDEYKKQYINYNKHINNSSLEYIANLSNV